MKPRVVYWNNIPAPYVVERFGALPEEKPFSFEAWFSGRTSRGRSWEVEEDCWDFSHRYLPSVGQGEYPLAFPAPLLKERVPDLLVTLYAAPSFLFGSLVQRARGGRLAYWVEPTEDAVVRRREWKEALKRRLFRAADGILTTGDDGIAFTRRYRAPSERTFVVPHVVDAARYGTARSRDPRERTRYRDGLGLRGVTFAYVGRLLPLKGVRNLVDAFGEVQRSTAMETSLLLVGDGPEERALRDRVRLCGVQNVVFTGFRGQSELPQLLGAADVFVFPTLGDTFGMAVSEAVAAGLPVIATTATGEIRQRVEDGVNGFQIRPGDPASLRDRMRMLLEDEPLRARMATSSFRRLADQSPSTWARAFETAVAQILELPPRATPRGRRLP